MLMKYTLLQSAKTNLNVEEVFFSIARDIKQRLADTDNKAEVFKPTISPVSQFHFPKPILSHFLTSRIFRDILIAADNNQNQPRLGSGGWTGCPEIGLLWLRTHLTN